MFRRSLSVALVLATTTLGAQTTAPNATQQPAAPGGAPRAAALRYVPAILQERMITITGCLQNNEGWVLTGATLAGQQEAGTYKLLGIADARLALFEGKRIEATGALPLAGKAASPAASPTAAAKIAASPSPAAARDAQASPASPAGQPGEALFEATAVKEATGAGAC